MRKSVRWGVWVVVLGAMGLGALPAAVAGVDGRCSGDPMAALAAFQQAVRGAQGWDDTSYDRHLTQAARQRLHASRAKVDFSVSLGQGAPLQGWTPQQTLDQRKATALRMLQEQVAAWPVNEARLTQKGSAQATVRVSWHDEVRGNRVDGAVLTQRQHEATVQIQCDAGLWRVASEESQVTTREVLTTPDGLQHAGSKLHEVVRWP